MTLSAYELASRFMQPFKVKGEEIVPKYCPFCNGGKHNDQDTFALNADKNTYNCKRQSCAVTGTLNQLAEHFGVGNSKTKDYEYRPRKRLKRFKKPQSVLNSVGDRVGSYLNTRGISRETWEKNGVGEKDGAIAFPYYENGDLVLVKFRIGCKYIKDQHPRKAWREEGGKAVFWGMDACKPELPLVIVEGEMDKLVLDECGVPNAVSVPSGAKDLSCLDNCWDWINKFNKVIIWPDNDPDGNDMAESLIARLGAWRCSVIKSPHKDANVCLHREGKEAVVNTIANAEEVKIKHLVRLAEVKAINYRDMEKISTGFHTLDSLIGGMFMDSLTIWTGINASGKSTVLGQIMLNVIDQGEAVCAYSGELPKTLFKYWVNLQASGAENLKREFDPMKKADVPVLIPEVCRRIESWYYDKFFLFDSADGVSNGSDILAAFEYAARRYGCKVFLIDNLMTTNFKQTTNLNQAQTQFVAKVKEFCKKFHVHVHLVAHPRKATGRITKMDVAGTGNITNLADNVISVHRVTENDRKEPEAYGRYDYVDNLVEVFKDRINGVQNTEITMKFDKFSKRMYETKYPNDINKNYSWLEVEEDEYLPPAPWDEPANSKEDVPF